MRFLKSNLVYKVMVLSISVGLSISAMSADWMTTRNLAQQGDAQAQYELGYMYFFATDENAESDPTKSFEWFSKAAKQGHPEAQTQLGMMYGGGFGVRRDDSKSMYWYKEAAAQGDAEAILTVDCIMFPSDKCG